MAAVPTPDYGYFVDSDDECDVDTEAEPYAGYLETENRYCPLRIGQVIGADPRFRIEHKLGWGGFSTVWLARNLATDRLFALKVMSPGWRANHERKMNIDIVQKAGEDISDYLVTSQTYFCIRGRRGLLHGVLVFPWRGPSLQHILPELPPTFRMSAANRLLVGLKRLHAAGIVHSDINEGAVMWRIAPGVDRWSTSEVYKHLGRPSKIQLREDLGGGELVRQVEFPLHMLRPDLYLGDFGHSIISGTVPRDPVQLPLLYCAPERFHGFSQSFASDMWSFMCILVNLYLRIEVAYGDGLSFVSRLVGALGPFPPHWRGRFPEHRGHDWWYDQTGTMPRTKILGNYETLERKIDRLRPEISPEERRLALEVFRKGFEYCPEKRITAAQLLEDPSFKGLMAYY
ncbi:kinase-like protein [Xylaria sp. FL0064]|nr:kinase-like protein [Xylaria sp. FL0064]